MNDKFKTAGLILWLLTLILIGYLAHLRSIQLEKESAKVQYHLSHEQAATQNSFVLDTINNHQMIRVVLLSYNDRHSFIYIHKTYRKKINFILCFALCVFEI